MSYGGISECYSDAQFALSKARKLMRELYKKLSDENKEELKKIDIILLNGSSAISEDDCVGCDGKPQRPNWFIKK